LRQGRLPKLGKVQCGTTLKTKTQLGGTMLPHHNATNYSETDLQCATSCKIKRKQDIASKALPITKKKLCGGVWGRAQEERKMRERSSVISG